MTDPKTLSEQELADAVGGQSICAFPDVCWTPPQNRLEIDFGDITPGHTHTALSDDDLDAVQGGLDVTTEMGVQEPPVSLNAGHDDPVFVRKTPPRPISAGPGHLGPRACIHEKREL